jgi:multidrug efflux pump subunit AcrA (membrane-fusion protein)
VTRKIFLVLMLAATVTIAAKAIGQAPGGGAGAAPSLNPPTGTPAATQPSTKTPATPSFAAPKSTESTAPSAKTAAPSTANPSSTTVDSKVDSKSPTAGKTDSTATSKTFSTSTSVPPPSNSTTPSSTTTPGSTTAPSRRELVLERCLVTLIDDNKIPASEAGMIIKIEVKEGNSIEKGFLVAEIDTRSTLAKQRIAAAEVAAATAQAENNAEVEVAEAAIEVAAAELQQSEDIRAKNPNAVSLSQWRKDKFNYEKSLAQKKQAINEKKIAGLTANAKQAQYDAASIEIDLRQVRAPFRGEVVEVTKNVGDWVTVGEPIMHIVGLDKVKVKGFVLVSGPNGASQEEVIGKDVKITVEAAGGKKRTVAGKIGFASPVIEGVGTSRQFRIWAEVDNTKTVDSVTKQEIWDLQPGSVATMTIDLVSSRPAASAIAPATSPDASKSGKGKVESYKPVTGTTNAAKSTAKER